MNGIKRRTTQVSMTALLLLCLVPSGLRAYTIAVFKTEEVSAYTEPVESFKQTVDEALGPNTYVEYNMEDDHKVKGPRIIETMKANKPDLIFALGNKAAYLVARNLPDVPAIFASVINWPKYQLKTDSMTGIAMEVPEETVLMQFKMVAPDLKNIGMLYNPQATQEVVDRAKSAAAGMGLEIIAVQVDKNSNLLVEFNKLAGRIDGFWMHADQIYNDEAVFKAISDSAIKNHIALMTPSENFVVAGGLVSVSWSYSNIGSQSGATAVSILRDGAKPADTPVAAPIGATFVLNTDTAAALGLKIDELVYSYADRIIGVKNE